MAPRTAPGVYLLPHTLGCFRRDLALVGASGADERILLEPFLEDEIIRVAKPGAIALANGSIDPVRIADHLLLAREPGSASRQLVERALAQLDVRPL
ncbi:MAG: LysR substrate-binding domain-containing protein, partial [Actinomycetota bacterium]|nr:LysR substrate-binding domain-containing protein [Actinomycetota bacterium]